MEPDFLEVIVKGKEKCVSYKNEVVVKMKKTDDAELNEN